MRSARLGVPLAIALSFSGGAAIQGLAACGSTGSSTVSPPITGITVRAESVTQGRGCGRGGTQVFKYGVHIRRSNFTTPDVDAGIFPRGDAFTNPVVGVFDCFTDANFVDVPPNVNPQTGANEYFVEIYAFNEPSYLASGGDAAIIQGMVSPGGESGLPYQWTTSCTVGQLELVQSLAACRPLTDRVYTADAGEEGGPGIASITFGTQTFPGGDSGTLRCGPDYTTVRYRSSIDGALPGEIQETPCTLLTFEGPVPATVTISPAVAPASYRIELALLKADGTTVGSPTCTAATAPGVTTSAVCGR